MPSQSVAMESAVAEELGSAFEFFLITNFVLDAVGVLVVGKEGGASFFWYLISLSLLSYGGGLRFLEVAIMATITSVTVVMEPLNCPPPKLRICLYCMSARFINS